MIKKCSKTGVCKGDFHDDKFPQGFIKKIDAELPLYMISVTWVLDSFRLYSILWMSLWAIVMFQSISQVYFNK